MKNIHISGDTVGVFTGIVLVITLCIFIIHWAITTSAEGDALRAKNCASFDKAVAALVVDHPQEVLALEKLRGNIC